jgi:DNA-binding MarR family transcriptional regulator
MSNNLERLIKQSVPFKSDYVKAELGLIYVSSLINNEAFHYYKRYQLSLQQYNILRILRGQFPRAINISSIKERMLDRMSDVSRIAERLSKMGLIIKQPNMIDKRNADITISEKGLELLRLIDEDGNNHQSLIHKLAPEDISQLNGLLDKILNGI